MLCLIFKNTEDTVTFITANAPFEEEWWGYGTEAMVR